MAMMPTETMSLTILTHTSSIDDRPTSQGSHGDRHLGYAAGASPHDCGDLKNRYTAMALEGAAGAGRGKAPKEHKREHKRDAGVVTGTGIWAAPQEPVPMTVHLAKDPTTC